MSADMRIGIFRLDKELSRSPNGSVVYLAFDDHYHQCHVTIEVLPDHVPPEQAQAFLAEALSFAKLNHSNLVPIFDVGRTEDGKSYVVSKFIDPPWQSGEVELHGP